MDGPNTLARRIERVTGVIVDTVGQNAAPSLAIAVGASSCIGRMPTGSNAGKTPTAKTDQPIVTNISVMI